MKRMSLTDSVSLFLVLCSMIFVAYGYFGPKTTPYRTSFVSSKALLAEAPSPCLTVVSFTREKPYLAAERISLALTSASWASPYRATQEVAKGQAQVLFQQVPCPPDKASFELTVRGSSGWTRTDAYSQPYKVRIGQ